MVKITKKDKIFIEGKRIYLREIRLSDVNENYLRWMNDSEVTQFLESRFSPQTLETIKDYVKKTTNFTNSILLAIILKKGDKHIGNIRISNIDRNHGSADIGLMLGEKKEWGKGYGSEAIKLVVDCALNKLNLRRLTAYIYGNNMASIKAFGKAGFKDEGTRKEMRLYKGRYVDEKIFGIVKK